MASNQTQIINTGQPESPPAEESKMIPSSQPQAQQFDSVIIKCPFCKQSHKLSEQPPGRSQLPFLVHNRMLDNLLSKEITQDRERMDAEQEERTYRVLAKQKLIGLADDVLNSCRMNQLEQNTGAIDGP